MEMRLKSAEEYNYVLYNDEVESPTTRHFAIGLWPLYSSIFVHAWVSDTALSTDDDDALKSDPAGRNCFLLRLQKGFVFRRGPW